MSDKKGITLQEYLLKENISNSEFSRRIPCSFSLPGIWMRGDSKPCEYHRKRIAQVTHGEVPVSVWDDKDEDEDIKYDVNMEE